MTPLPNGDRTDDYYWMRDDTRTNEKVLAYLRAENAYTEREMAGTKQLEEQLFSEIAKRTKPDDSTVPVSGDSPKCSIACPRRNHVPRLCEPFQLAGLVGWEYPGTAHAA